MSVWDVILSEGTFEEPRSVEPKPLGWIHYGDGLAAAFYTKWQANQMAAATFGLYEKYDVSRSIDAYRSIVHWSSEPYPVHVSYAGSARQTVYDVILEDPYRVTAPAPSSLADVQRELGLAADGILGPQTIRALSELKEGPRAPEPKTC